MGEVAEKAEHSDADVGNLHFLHTPGTGTGLHYKQNDVAFGNRKFTQNQDTAGFITTSSEQFDSLLVNRTSVR